MGRERRPVSTGRAKGLEGRSHKCAQHRDYLQLDEPIAGPLSHFSMAAGTDSRGDSVMSLTTRGSGWRGSGLARQQEDMR